MDFKSQNSPFCLLEKKAAWKFLANTGVTSFSNRELGESSGHEAFQPNFSPSEYNLGMENGEFWNVE